jgi:hypothetical protein
MCYLAPRHTGAYIHTSSRAFFLQIKEYFHIRTFETYMYKCTLNVRTNAYMPVHIAALVVRAPLPQQVP